jgi:hypothetical protein
MTAHHQIAASTRQHPADDGSVLDGCLNLILAGEMMVERMRQDEWQREEWERSVAVRQAAYWARRDRERGL